LADQFNNHKMCSHNTTTNLSAPVLHAKPIKIKKPGQPCIDIPCGDGW